MPGPAKQIRYFFEWWLVSATLRLVPTAPRGLLRLIAHGLGTLAFFVHADGRRTAIANLHAAFPGRYTDEEVEDLALQCYRSWAQTFLDQFWTRNLTAETFRQYVAYEFPPGLDVATIRRRGAIWMMPHYSNFEWGAAGLSFFDIHYTAIAQDFKNPRLTPLFLRNRERLGHQIVSRDRAMLKLLRVLKKGGHAAFLPDLTIPPDQSATTIEVFGLKVCVTALGPFLAQRSGRPIICGLTMPLSDGSYLAWGPDVIEVGPEDSIPEIAQRCWDSVEPYIRRYPTHWLWMYKHFRFLPKDATRAYPPYANRSQKFDALESAMAGDGKLEDLADMEP